MAIGAAPFFCCCCSSSSSENMRTYLLCGALASVTARISSLIALAIICTEQSPFKCHVQNDSNTAAADCPMRCSSCCFKLAQTTQLEDLWKQVMTYLGIFMAQAQIADHLIRHAVCCVSCQVKVKFYCFGCTCSDPKMLLQR